MPTYRYSCVVCGAFDLLRPMRESGAATECPSCARPARRVIAAPALRSLSSGLRGALDAQHRSADVPQVVSALPPRTGRVQRQVTDPRQMRLPRP